MQHLAVHGVAAMPLKLPVDGSGNVTTIDTGYVTIAYTVVTSCGAISQSVLLLVSSDTSEIIPSLTGITEICLDSTTTLYSSIPIGYWSTGGFWGTYYYGAVSITDSGFLTGLHPGLTEVFYITTFVCDTLGEGSSGYGIVITIDGPPSEIVLHGSDTVNIADGPFTVIDSAPSGIWSSSDTFVATIDSFGDITPIAPGTTTISYYVYNACADSTVSIPITVIGLTTSEKNVSGRSSLQVYPNPAKNTINISYHPASAGQNATFILTDVTGRDLLSMPLMPDKGGESLNINGLPTGLYFYKVLQNNSIISVGKIIKE